MTYYEDKGIDLKALHNKKCEACFRYIPKGEKCYEKDQIGKMASYNLLCQSCWTELQGILKEPQITQEAE